jgi:hypothetical protein
MGGHYYFFLIYHNLHFFASANFLAFSSGSSTTSFENHLEKNPPFLAVAALLFVGVATGTVQI